MAKTLEKILKEYFPDAVYVTSGLDADKWETKHYLFSLRYGFYTSKTTRNTNFVHGKSGWNEIFKQLKNIDKKYEETNLLGKG